MSSSSTLLLMVVLFLEPPAGMTLTTAAGTGQQGYGGDGGPAIRAQLDQPFDVALDAKGNVFFSDTFNHRIRRIDAETGVITTVAGRGEAGFSGDGGPAIEARLHEPYGVCLDAQGTLYFVDRLNRRIRRVDAVHGHISTVAGNGKADYGGDGGPAVAAGLIEPNGVALDPSGRTLYIADVAGHRIRRVDLASGRIDTFAGTGRSRHEGDGGPAGRASIRGARAVAVGPDGTVFILEREGNSLRAVDPGTGLIRTIAGTGRTGHGGDDGPAAAATFNGPKELDVDRAGNLWIVDTENHAIRFIDRVTGRILTAAGNGKAGGDGDGGPGPRGRLNRPHGVAVGPDGSVWIGDTNNHRLRRLVPAR
jgi:sugar lactone lactonase YvrE